jgi:hemolysin activation/secretion protein
VERWVPLIVAGQKVGEQRVSVQRAGVQRVGERVACRRSQLLVGSLGLCFLLAGVAPGFAQDQAPAPAPSADNPQAATPAAAPAAPPEHFDIDDFAIDGAETLAQTDIEEAVYPFLGPDRTSDDVEKARAALEKAYKDKGFQTVTVAISPQKIKGVVVLKVTEFKVAHLRVKNAHYFDTQQIKAQAPSLKEGTVPNFNAVTQDIVALNQWPDRRVTPSLRAGTAPGTVDVDLDVDDKVPVHGSLEFNDRQSPNTTPDRITATAHYDNLWQLGHSLSITYQIAPERSSDAESLSVSYLSRIPTLDWVSFLTYGVKSNSDVAIVGGFDVVGPGSIVGQRAIFTLPTRDNFYHTFSVGLDYKYFQQQVGQAGQTGSTPITYYPMVGAYSATFQADKALTQFDATVTHGLRGLGSSPTDFDNKRFEATGDFISLKADLSRTQELPWGFQFYTKVQGQLADQPLVSSEQFALGGLDTVRGYLEVEMLGDNGLAGTAEFRTPDMGQMIQGAIKNANPDNKSPVDIFDSWRLFTFVDAGAASIYQPLPEQEADFNAWSYGVGTTVKMFNYANGMIVYSIPKITQTYTIANTPRINFRVWGEF